MKKLALVTISCLLMPALASAQMRAEDVDSVNAIIDSLYDVISGTKEEARDWDRFYSLFDDDARLIFASSETVSGFQSRTPKEYRERSEGAFARNDFFEIEISRESQIYGNIAHIFSTYAGARSPDGEPFIRGINSIQLARKEGRWFIETIFWQAESDEFPLPGKYLD